MEFDRMLLDADQDRTGVFCTNVCKYRPPENEIEKFFLDKKCTLPGAEVLAGCIELAHELNTIESNVVVPMGNVALWALTGHRGITSWRGSILPHQGYVGVKRPDTELKRPFKVIPTYHPAAILRMWAWRQISVHDLRRAKREADAGARLTAPAWQFLVRPSFDATMSRLADLRSKAGGGALPLAVDIETRNSHTACIGFAWDKLNALCVPLLDVKKPDKSYWTLEEEGKVVLAIRDLLLHPNVQVIGQNFLYDLQYLARYWGLAPRVRFDTMVAQHCIFPGTPKGLDYLSSMYCEFHQYWKDEGKLFDPEKHDEEKLWTYNCRDAVATYEVWEAQQQMLTQLDRWEQFRFQMHEVYPVLFGMMLRGVRFDQKLRATLFGEISAHVAERQKLINTLVGRPINVRSPKQLQELFYQEFQQRPILNMKTGNVTTDDDAMVTISKREPILRPICGAVNEIRSLGAASNIVMTPTDVDGRIRCSYNIAGAESFRLSSSENAFGTGTNLQNVTEGKKSELTGLMTPNLRRLITPDPEHGMLDGDLQKADLYVVVWEAHDDGLKAALRRGLDLHLYNARDVYGRTGYLNMPDDELIDGTEVCEEHKRRYRHERQNCKNGVHATDYGAMPPKLSKLLGCTVREAAAFQQRWFAQHPGIKQWHIRTMMLLNTERCARNRFGYVRYYFDRIEDCFTEALAWVPQSTVAIVINKILVALDKHCKHLLQLLLQTHDSFTAQFLLKLGLELVLKEIHPHTRIVVPYDDPLIIPMSYKFSTSSWGECKSVNIPLA